MVQQLNTTSIAVFLAELGDKTQIATFSFAANPDHHRWIVLLGACTALLLITLIAVLIGAKDGDLVNPKYLKIVPGLLFDGVGLFTLWK